MSTREFSLWKEFDRMSPISDDRADVLTAHLASTVARGAGAKVTLQDMLIRWSADAVAETETATPGHEGNFKAFLQSRIRG